LIAAGLVGIWALLADGPFSSARVIGLSIHRRGLLVVAVGMAVVPFATGEVHNLEVLLPCLGAAAVLLRLGLVRVPAGPALATAVAPPGAAPTSRHKAADAVPPSPPAVRSAPAPSTPPAAAPDPTPVGEPAGAPSAVRATARLAGRATSIAAQKADVAVPRGARVAGRLVGRFRARDH